MCRRFYQYSLKQVRVLETLMSSGNELHSRVVTPKVESPVHFFVKQWCTDDAWFWQDARHDFLAVEMPPSQAAPKHVRICLLMSTLWM